MLLAIIASKNNALVVDLTLSSSGFYRQAWMALGDMSKEHAMEAYVKLLLQSSPAFRTYLHDAPR